MSGIVQALDGVKVVEFGAYAAGPHVGKLLANFGATVVHVESEDRPDGFRLQYPPFAGGKQGINRSGCFALFNDSKYGVTIDLKKPDGLDLARRLVAWCDVIVENMRPGVMDRLGLGWEQVKAINPRVVMLSSCNMGQTGPRADTPGFGSQLSALAGFCNLTGAPDGMPMLLYGPYIDFIASSIGTSAVLAGLLRRLRSGEGAHLDLSQYEAGLLFLAGALWDYHAHGTVAARAGNADPEAAPHGAFRCGDGQWLALSVWSDEEFRRLAGAIGRPELPASRRRDAAAMREAIEDWAAGRTAEEAAQVLQKVDLAAYPVNTVAKLFTDPQIVARRLWRKRRHPEMGEHAYEFAAFDLSETPGDITTGAPVLGADNETVLCGLLGMSEEDFQQLRARKVVG